MIVVPGRTEAIRRYDEIMWDFVQMGYSPIFCMDHRGQGESDRLIADPAPGYVEHAQDYTIDMREFVARVTAELAGNDDDKDKPLFLFCHSMGCAVSFAYLVEEYEKETAHPMEWQNKKR